MVNQYKIYFLKLKKVFYTEGYVLNNSEQYFILFWILLRQFNYSIKKSRSVCLQNGFFNGRTFQKLGFNL
jgi:hypothetical protein